MIRSALLMTLGESGNRNKVHSQLIPADASDEIAGGFLISKSSRGQTPDSGQFIVVKGTADGQDEIVVSDENGDGTFDGLRHATEEKSAANLRAARCL